jgi:hypothetical protein
MIADNTEQAIQAALKKKNSPGLRIEIDERRDLGAVVETDEDLIPNRFWQRASKFLWQGTGHIRWRFREAGLN